ncbi:MAG: 50S ribosomal protein L25 [Actinomycetota bacterium]|nr:50S ribosomal protein L25 [Actinomycetota bacterium]
MADNTLIAEPRTERGSRPAGRLRRSGKVPAIVYGMGGESDAIAVLEHDLQHILTSETGSNSLITLRMESGEQLALARQIHRHPVKGTIVHVDFIRISADVAVSAEITMNLEGDPEGVKRGGHLEQMIFQISIEAKPGDLPPSMSYDVSAMEIGDQIHISDITPPPGVTITNDPEELVAQLAAPRVAEVEEGAAAEGEAAEGEAAAEGGAPAGESSSES